MDEMENVSTKEIIERTMILMGIIIAIIFIAIGINYYRKIYLGKVFLITYIEVSENIYGESDGIKYTIYNNTNDTYEITEIYIEVSDTHKTYKIPYKVWITLQPHETEDFTLLYSEIGGCFGKDSYSCTPVVKRI